MTTATITRHACPGLRPEPLASYLAGLGLIRVIGEQADPAATAAWTPDGLAITTTVNDIAAWLADEYVPTPVLSPWNSGSGFGAKDKEPLRALEALLAHPSPRLDPLQAAIPVAPAGGRQGTRSGAGSLTAAPAGTRAGSFRSSVTGARTSCCRGSTRRSCWPGRTRSSRRCSAPAGTTAGSTSPPTSISGCST